MSLDPRKIVLSRRGALALGALAATAPALLAQQSASASMNAAGRHGHGRSCDSSAQAEAVVTSAAVPSGVASSADFTVTAAGVPVGLFDAGENAWGSPISFGSFQMSGGTATIDVTVAFSFASAAVVPASAGIASTRSGDTLTFALDGPQDVSIVFDGDYQGRTLHLFAQAPDPDAPSDGDRGVRYFGPGLHEITGDPVFVGSDETLYLAAGAVLRGRVRIQNADGAAIRGRGVLLNDTSPSGGYDDVAIAISHSSNVIVDGITTNRSLVGWTGFISESSNVTVTDYHVVSPTYASTDGFDINNCSNVLFDDVFIRSCDDAVSIKGYAPEGGYKPLSEPASATAIHDIVYRNSQLWADANNGIVVGEETIAAR